MSQPRSSNLSHMEIRINQYRRDRKKFALNVYFLALIFLAISLVQWLPLRFCKECERIIEEFYFIPMIFLLMGLVTVSVMVFLPRLRFMFPLNWIMTISIVELITLGLTLAAVNVSVAGIGIFFTTVMAIVIICLAFGMLVKFDITLNVVVLFIFSIVFFVGMVFFLTIYLISGMHFTIVVYSIFIIAIVMLFLMYHSQTIQGGRYAEMRLKDYLLAALIIYHDFVILLMAFLALDVHFFKL